MYLDTVTELLGLEGNQSGLFSYWPPSTVMMIERVRLHSSFSSPMRCVPWWAIDGELILWNIEKNVALPSDVRECKVINLDISNNYSVLSVVEPSLASLHLYIPGKKYIWTLTSHNVASKITAAKISTSGMMVVTG